MSHSCGTHKLTGVAHVLNSIPQAQSHLDDVIEKYWQQSRWNRQNDWREQMGLSSSQQEPAKRTNINNWLHHKALWTNIHDSISRYTELAGISNNRKQRMQLKCQDTNHDNDGYIPQGWKTKHCRWSYQLVLHAHITKLLGCKFLIRIRGPITSNSLKHIREARLQKIAG